MLSPIASLVFYGWPLVVLVLFRLFSRPMALSLSIVGGYLLLPNGAGFDLPLIPSINKDVIPALATLAAILAGLGTPRRPPTARLGAGPGPRPMGADATTRSGARLIQALIALLLLSPLITIFSNSEPVFAGPRVLPGLRPYDGFSIIANQLFALLPFLLAQRYLRTSEDHKTLLKALVVLMLIYSLPTLWEIRMSPQLHKQIYGFTQFNFRQQIRGGGWRPVVFLPHGLWLAIFTAMATVAAAALVRHLKGGQSWKWLLAVGWLAAVLFLSNSVGALVIAVLLVPLVLLLGVRGQLLVAGAAAAVVLIYPAMRGADLIPTEKAVELAQYAGPQRAGSLNYRFENEDVLLARAALKPVAGWGGYGRGRIFNDEGRDVSVTDGAWIIIIGSYGWLGYIARFGLLCLPLIFLMIHRRQMQVTLATAGLAMVLAVNLIDLIPNGTLTPVTWLIGGALAGRYALGRIPDSDAPDSTKDPSTAAVAPGPAYTRFPKPPRPSPRAR